MTAPARSGPVAVVPDKQPAGCERCAANAKALKELRSQVRQLTEQNERLTRALHRESHHIDERVNRNK